MAVKSAATISRRSLLGLAALALGACKKGSSASASRAEPDAAALASARATELALIAAYDSFLDTIQGSAVSHLLAERALHTAHLAALGGSAAGPSPAATSTPAAIPSLLRNSASSLRAAAVAAVDGVHAAVFASTAASHEVMLSE